MPTFFKQPCPLCSSEAEYCWVGAHNYKYFECPSCSYYQISRRAEQILSEQPQQRRDLYASQAPEAPENSLLVIRMPDHDHRLSSTDVLQAGFVEKSELDTKCE